MAALGQDPPDTTSFSQEHDHQQLSEAQLRQLYDEEEVERFISFFSAYVTEFRLSAEAASAEPHVGNGIDSVDAARGSQVRPPNTDHALSEYVAYNYLLPYLPPATSVVPTFTLKRLGLTTQRLYLALFPPYQTFLLDLARLALWKDYQRSLRHCIIFWLLWFHDLLLPALVFRIVYGLIRRRLSAYPSLKELQDRRQETAQALEFWEAIQHHLSASTIGPIEMWRLFKLYKSGGEARSIHLTESDEEESLRRDLLHIMNELADIHERVKNIFTWRSPYMSCRYLVFFIAIGVGTLVLPARHIAKVVYWVGGMLFWHFVPVVAALPQADRMRALRLFIDGATDAEYAMDLIAKRIATGQEVGKAPLRDQPYRMASSASVESLTSTLYSIPPGVRTSETDGIDWKKWNERVARGKSYFEEGRRVLSSHSSQHSVPGEMAPSVGGPSTENAHTFLAQYSSSSGLITLTPSTLFFTPLMRSRATLVVPRDRLQGVRRSGLMKGLCITWAPEGNGEGKEERFHWVASRDELFARLVGTDRGRWVRV